MFKRAVFAWCFSVLLCSPASAAVTRIDRCSFTITEPGHYRLSQDLHCNLNDGITIMADNVDLDFAGHTLTVSGTGSDGVRIEGANARIYGQGTITNTWVGIRINNSGEGARIQNMTTTVNFIGILVSADETTLIANRADDARTGIEISSDNNVVRANRTERNVFGIRVAVDSEGTVLQTNRAHGNTIFDLAGACDFVTWKSNQFDTASDPCIE
jgi:hypothetical protein